MGFEKLLTKDDPISFHKTFGLLSVCSFIYRYGYVYPTQGNLGFEGTHLDWATMIVHTMLSCSAIIFRVPAKRIDNKPMVIYEEYRQHAMVFTLRCFSVFVVAQLFPQAPTYVMPLVVAAHHLVADNITSRHGKPGNTAVRSTRDKQTSFYSKVGLFYSFYQFLAIASHIGGGHPRLSDLAYNALIAIQSSAFMMTLYRKRIVRGRTHMGVYSFCLLLSMFHICRLLGGAGVAAVALVFYARVNYGISKYVLWTLYLLSPFAATLAPGLLATLPLPLAWPHDQINVLLGHGSALAASASATASSVVGMT